MPVNLRRLYAVRVLSYLLIIIFTLALQNALPVVAHVRPQLLIVLTALAALFQGPRTGGAVGFFCGMLADWLSVYSVAYYTVILLLIGVLFGMLADYGIRRTILSALFIAALTLAVTQFFYFTFYLLIPGRADFSALLDITVPELIYSVALLPVIFFPVRTVYRRTRLKRKG